MANIPEHLLARSKAKRAALSGETVDTPKESTPKVESAKPEATLAATVEEVKASGPVRVLPKAPKRVPWFAWPVIGFLPIWAIMFAGTFASREQTKVLTGEEIYLKYCAGCHAANGSGGTGPKLAGGEAVKTFPDEADHIEWIKTGSAPFRGKQYGDPNREGGAHTSTGGMPAFASQLSDEEIQLVTTYEREDL